MRRLLVFVPPNASAFSQPKKLGTVGSEKLVAKVRTAGVLVKKKFRMPCTMPTVAACGGTTTPEKFVPTGNPVGGGGGGGVIGLVLFVMVVTKPRTASVVGVMFSRANGANAKAEDLP